MMIDLMGLGCGWGMELVLKWGRVLHRTRIQFPKKLFGLVFCSCWFCFRRLGFTLVRFYLKQEN
jgi:hypothetical protein